MSSYTFTKSVNDTGVLFAYIKNTLPTLTDLVLTSTTTLKLIFSAALTTADQTTLTALVAAYADPRTDEDSTEANISVLNSTSAALAANGVFTGAWEDVSRFASIRITYTANVVSATGGVSLQFGVTAKQADLTKAYTLSTDSSKYSQVTQVLGRYFRVVYTNGATAQTTFSLATFWGTQPGLYSLQAGETLVDQNDCLLTRAVVCARNEYQQYSNLRVDEQDLLRVRHPRSFERDLSVQQFPWIQTSFTYGVNIDATNTAVTASGTVTSSSARAVVSTGAAANSSALLASDKYCICGPGNSVLVICSAAFGAGVAGSTQVLGAGNLVNGLFWGYNGTAFGVAVRSNSVTTWVPQASFNVDTLQGSGSSGVTLVPTFGNTFAVAYDALGYGSVTFLVRSPAANSTNPNVSLDDYIVAHRISFANTSTSVGLLNPQFPCTAIATNTTNTSAVSISVATFTAFMETSAPQRALNTIDAYRSVTSTTGSPFIALQNKTTFGGVTNCSTILLRHISVAMTNGSRNLVLTVLRNATLTNMGTYTDVAATSCASYSVAVLGGYTAGTGDAVFSGTAFGDHQQYDVSHLGIYLSPGSILAILAKVSTNATINTTMGLTWNELQ